MHYDNATCPLCQHRLPIELCEPGDSEQTTCECGAQVNVLLAMHTVYYCTVPTNG